MDSRQLSQKYGGFSEWYPFNEQSLESTPEQSGFYIFRRPQGEHFGRLQGKSDIGYIGSTNNVRRRIREHLHPKNEDWPEIQKYDMAKKYNMEFSWCISEKEDQEQVLLHQYRKEHDEFPPLNNADIIKYHGDISGDTPLPPEAYENSAGDIICPNH